MRFGQLFCLVFIPYKNDWQQLYNETDLYKANKLIYRFILDNNLASDNIPLMREDLL